MPQLRQYKWLLDVPFFIYPTKEAALNGKNFGGTGFLVAIPSDIHPDKIHHIYAVTNAHVVFKGSTVLRFNKKSGGTDIFETDPGDWISIPGAYDIAVLPVNFLNPQTHKVEALNLSYTLPGSYYVQPKEDDDFDINVGDDVFMIGRFIDHDGTDINLPSLRFGNISIIDAPVKHPEAYVGSSIVLDMHSRSGYSGSPVFVYRTSGSLFLEEDKILVKGHMLKLLGIHWGQFPEKWALEERKQSPKEAALIVNEKYIQGLSGMTMVCPTKGIIDILKLPDLVQKRKEHEQKILNQ